MIFRIGADLVLTIHLAFIGFVVMGGLFALKWPKAAWLHLPAALWGALVEFTGRVCPLTPLENKLRHSGGRSTYAEGFIERYLTPLIYPEGLTREIQIMLGIGVVFINVLIYGMVMLRFRRCSRRPDVTPILTDEADTE